MICEIKRPDGETIELLILPHFAYVLPDGSRASATPTIAWCHHCRSFVAAESISTDEDLDKWITEASIPPYSERVQFIINGDESSRKRMLHDNQKQKEWLALRKTAAKCLECGSADCQYTPDDSSVFPHPDDGSDISVSVVFGSTSIDHKLFLLDVEGHRIGETIYAA